MADTDVRSLLRQERAARRVRHKHASYTTSGTLQCTVCAVPVKSEARWEGHLRSAGHVAQLARMESRHQQQQQQQEEKEIETETDKDEEADEPRGNATGNGVSSSSSTNKRKAEDDADDDSTRKRSRPSILAAAEGDESARDGSASISPVNLAQAMPSRTATPASQAREGTAGDGREERRCRRGRMGGV